MENIKESIPFLIPIIIVEFSLMLAAVVHILKHDKFKIGNKVIWIIVSVFIQIIGPILYFTIGRSDE
ncbi:Phospholipase_D-nuclease N-terminal [Clostridium cavendishii DSM 21758]|uniref:Phospholipase_D-nuclease N-terminal n=1 Tax=Clostridium cavendishii DSM 21758 TaxID=1121302 RepID=A0A1M6CC01_9CLOT|nr:PLD nuclease N-terminal domain-containing protein [Clostridium cavendishii]SHI58314.1 Phospholipase_D-nuclease N-terminal [Clostridium cavendishii DSM 21758]